MFFEGIQTTLKLSYNCGTGIPRAPIWCVFATPVRRLQLLPRAATDPCDSRLFDCISLPRAQYPIEPGERKTSIRRVIFKDEIHGCLSMTILSISVSNSQGPEFEYLIDLLF